MCLEEVFVARELDMPAILGYRCIAEPGTSHGRGVAIYIANA